MDRVLKLRALWLVVLAACLAFPATAGAGTIQNSGGEPMFTGGAGETNRLLVNGVAGEYSVTDGTVVFTDTANPLSIAAPNFEGQCTQINPNTVSCTGDYFRWQARLGVGDDELTAAGDLVAFVVGEDGVDILRGSSSTSPDGAPEYLSGGPGADRIFGNGGPDFIFGGEGADAVEAGAGEDRISDVPGDGVDNYDGGAGIDELLYEGGVVGSELDNLGVDLASGRGGRTNKEPEPDTLTGFEDAVYGGRLVGGIGSSGDGSGADTFLGSAVSNVLRTGSGNDVLDGRGGTDVLEAGDDDDQIQARDGAGDRVLCGEGIDTALIDQFDVVSGCEAAPVEFRRAEGADVAAPDCTVRRVRKRYAPAAFRKGIVARIACDEAATLSVQLLTTVRSGQIGGSKVGDLVIAQRSATSPGGTALTRVKVKPAKRYARRLARRKTLKVRLVVEARDQYGNRDRKLKRVKVAKPKKKRGKGRRRGKRR